MEVRTAVFIIEEDSPLRKRAVHLTTLIYPQIPVEGNYIRIPNQTSVGYKVEEVILLPIYPNNIWDVIVVASHGLRDFSSENYYEALSYQNNKVAAEARIRRQEIERYENPDKAWQRRKNIYERLKNGEEITTIAAEENVSATRIRTLNNDWARLQYRVIEYRREELERKENG